MRQKVLCGRFHTWTPWHNVSRRTTGFVQLTAGLFVSFNVAMAMDIS